MRFLVVLPLALAGLSGPIGVDVPFVWTPGQIELAVTVNGAPSTFLLDTGAEYSVVSTRLAQQLKLAVESRGAREFANGVTVGVGPLTMTDQRVMVMPFDTLHARGRPIDGLVGFDFFERFAVRIDFGTKTLTCWESAGFVAPPVAVTVPIAFAGRLPVVTGLLQLTADRRMPVRLMVDTGASQSVMLRHPFSLAHGLFALGTRETSTPSLESGARRMLEVPSEQLTVGGWTFDRPQVLAFAEPVGSAASTETDGLIGNTLLSRFTMYVDYARKRLLLEPRTR